MKLKPCPYCGGIANIERIGDSRISTIVRCEYCGCRLEGPETFNHGKQWNTRATDPLLKEMAEALAEIVRCLSHGLQDCRASVTAKAMLQKYREQAGDTNAK